MYWLQVENHDSVLIWLYIEFNWGWDRNVRKRVKYLQSEFGDLDMMKMDGDVVGNGSSIDKMWWKMIVVFYFYFLPNCFMKEYGDCGRKVASGMVAENSEPKNKNDSANHNQGCYDCLESKLDKRSGRILFFVAFWFDLIFGLIHGLFVKL